MHMKKILTETAHSDAIMQDQMGKILNQMDVTFILYSRVSCSPSGPCTGGGPWLEPLPLCTHYLMCPLEPPNKE